MNEQIAKKIISMANDMGEFCSLEDGYFYYCPSRGGALRSVDLRILADELDRKNKEWDEKIKAMQDTNHDT